MQQQQHGFQLKFINHEINKDIVYYTIQVVNTNSKLTWQFVERYKNMLQLHEQVSRLLRTPQFPGKKLYGNTDTEFISQRKAALQNYFKTLLSIADVDAILPLKQFLTRGEPKQVKEAKSEIEKQLPQQQQQTQQQLMQHQAGKQFGGSLQQQQVNTEKFTKQEYDKIATETNAKFIDAGFMVNAPDEKDKKLKKQQYDQVKIDPRSAELLRIHMKTNPDAPLLIANPTLEYSEPEFFQILQKAKQDIDKILEVY